MMIGRFVKLCKRMCVKMKADENNVVVLGVEECKVIVILYTVKEKKRECENCNKCDWTYFARVLNDGIV